MINHYNGHNICFFKPPPPCQMGSSLKGNDSSFNVLIDLLTNFAGKSTMHNYY